MQWTPGYREFVPPPWLHGTLSCFWVGVTPAGQAGRTLVLPDGCADLMWYRDSPAVLAGPDTGPAPVTQDAGTVVAGVRFRPGAAGAVLRLALSEAADQRVPAGEIPSLRGRLPSPSLPPGTALASLIALTAELASEHPADPAMTYAARLLRGHDASAASVARTLELSERQFRRRCEAAIGYGPATLRRVLRFRRFVSAVDAGRLGEGGRARGSRAGDSLAGVAIAAGYADQPHLSRECVRLSGLTPQALVRSRQAGS